MWPLVEDLREDAVLLLDQHQRVQDLLRRLRLPAQDRLREGVLVVQREEVHVLDEHWHVDRDDLQVQQRLLDQLLAVEGELRANQQAEGRPLQLLRGVELHVGQDLLYLR